MAIAVVIPLSLLVSSKGRPALRGVQQSPVVQSATVMQGLISRALHISTRRNASRLFMPALSPTMTRGKILQWYLKEGDAVAAGDPIFQVETDKASMDSEASEDGVLAKILRPEGSEVEVNETVAMLAEPDEDWKVVGVLDGTTGQVAAASPAASVPAKSDLPREPQLSDGSMRRRRGAVNDGFSLFPSVRRLLEGYQLLSEVHTMRTTGPLGRLLKGDVLDHIKSRNLKISVSPVESTEDSVDSEPERLLSEIQDFLKCRLKVGRYAPSLYRIPKSAFLGALPTAYNGLAAPTPLEYLFIDPKTGLWIGLPSVPAVLPPWPEDSPQLPQVPLPSQLGWVSADGNPEAILYAKGLWFAQFSRGMAEIIVDERRVLEGDLQEIL